MAEGSEGGVFAVGLKVLLFLPMLLYWLVVSARNFLYDKGMILKSRTFAIPYGQDVAGHFFRPGFFF